MWAGEILDKEKQNKSFWESPIFKCFPNTSILARVKDISSFVGDTILFESNPKISSCVNQFVWIAGKNGKCIKSGKNDSHLAVAKIAAPIHRKRYLKKEKSDTEKTNE